MNRQNFALISTSLAALLSAACGGDDTSDTAPLPASATNAVSTYSQIVYASYQDSLTAAEELDDALSAFIATPSAATHQAAQAAWLASREPYLQTEVYRFYQGPIDAEDGPEGLINAWPLDENHIDYVVDDQNPEVIRATGIVNNPQMTIDAATLEAQNEAPPGDKNISTGYHAIEFLLWGQDTNPNGPGQRPFTDYVTGGSGTAANQDRRGQYLSTASELLVEHLQGLVEAWAPNDADNYRAEFEAEAPAVALGRILSGMTILSAFETGGERLQAALDAKNQEEEHSCFSDNTHRDMIQDVRGVQNVWLGAYKRLDNSTLSGPSLRDMVAATDADLAREVTEKIADSLRLAEALVVPFEREIAPDNGPGHARVEALIDSLRDQGDLLDRTFELYGLTRIQDPG
jgi:putative iron-regulated protein